MDSGSSQSHSQTKIEMIDEQIKQLVLTKDKYQSEAALMVDSYWDEWKEENKRIHSMRQNIGDKDYVHTGRLAPRVYSPPNTHRVYIEWWDFRKHALRIKIKSFGVRIKPTKKGYTWSCVSKHANAWEKKFFIKYETPFKRIRESTNLICDNINTLNKVKRIHLKHIAKLNESINIKTNEEYTNG
ncbi:conjugative transfer protein MobI(A/C) (plasmid) [Shewanella sp. HL-SH4]|uniref:conjugative transfer protein MobI(A/C) n=1 Tax=Shewanella TaxID=22 RepID=UPI003D7A8B35